MNRRDVLRLAGAVLALPLCARAQEKYPDRPIRLVVPFAPGGETDIIGRLWAQKVAPQLGGGFVVENKPGAGGCSGDGRGRAREARRLHPAERHDERRT